MKDQMNIHNDKGFEDIEQLLQPQCDFHASSQTKQQVIEKARKSLVSHRTLRIFHGFAQHAWLASSLSSCNHPRIPLLRRAMRQWL